MRRDDKKNQNKQQQQNRIKKINAESSIYSSSDAYKIFTLIHLSKIPVNLDLSLPYNFILNHTENLSHHEISYMARCSDLLLLTVSSVEVDHNLISLIKRFMPTALIVFERKHKNIAKSVSKLFGDVKICEAGMLNFQLKNIITKNTHLCENRPFMVAKEVSIDGEHAYVQGFMKTGLRSNKIIINGLHEGVIEEVWINEELISGKDLNVEEDNSLLKPEEPAEKQVEDNENEEKEGNENEEVSLEECDLDDENISEDNELYGSEEEIDSEHDLITKYAEYRGIRNLATCTFRDQKKPAYYENIIFMKNIKYAQNLIKSKKSVIPANKFIKLKIKICTPICEKIFVLFNLFEFETRNTVYNYDFSSSEPLNKNVTVDNGYRIYNTSTILTRNLNNNVFKEEPTLDHGIVSFVGPFSFFHSMAFILEGNSVIKLQNGNSEDRVFFDCVVLRGKPVKIFKRYVVIKGMFFNKEQVEYFGNLKLEGKKGNEGFIKKALGTKGLFKAYFTQPIKHGEYITLSLYKRIFL